MARRPAALEQPGGQVWVETTRPRSSASEHRTVNVGYAAMSRMRRPSQADPKPSVALFRPGGRSNQETVLRPSRREIVALRKRSLAGRDPRPRHDQVRTTASEGPVLTLPTPRSRGWCFQPTTGLLWNLTFAFAAKTVGDCASVSARRRQEADPWGDRSTGQSQLAATSR
jgi:hypothetical protein